jgi:DNA-binding transcriptional MerR regulator
MPMARKTDIVDGKKIISVKDIMQKFHVTYQTVNHYTDVGLLPLAFKKGNVRFYQESLVKQRLSMITRLSREGYSLHLIRKKLLGV